MNDKKITISRSYSRKINLEHYGGKAYENKDYFASYSEEVSADASREGLKQTSQLLYDMARNDVEESVKEEIATLQKPRNKSIEEDHQKVLDNFVQE